MGNSVPAVGRGRHRHRPARAREVPLQAQGEWSPLDQESGAGGAVASVGKRMRRGRSVRAVVAGNDVRSAAGERTGEAGAEAVAASGPPGACGTGARALPRPQSAADRSPGLGTSTRCSVAEIDRVVDAGRTCAAPPIAAGVSPPETRNQARASSRFTETNGARVNDAGGENSLRLHTKIADWWSHTHPAACVDPPTFHFPLHDLSFRGPRALARHRSRITIR